MANKQINKLCILLFSNYFAYTLSNILLFIIIYGRCGVVCNFLIYLFIIIVGFFLQCFNYFVEFFLLQFLYCIFALF